MSSAAARSLAQALPPFLTKLSTKLTRPSAAHLLPLLTTTTLGHAPTALPLIYSHATSSLPPAPSQRSHAPALPSNDTNARRVLVREWKEALFKSAILIGVPKAIEALLELSEVVEDGARDDSFVREGLGEREWGAERVRERGDAGLERIYQGNIEKIWTMMGEDMKEIKWLSRQLTYGTFLAPHPPHTPRTPSPDPLARDPALLSIVTLSTLIPQRTPREILWHLRGALRNGMNREEVALVQESVEELCALCGVQGVGEGMPRVADVSVQKEERE